MWNAKFKSFSYITTLWRTTIGTVMMKMVVAGPSAVVAIYLPCSITVVGSSCVSHSYAAKSLKETLKITESFNAQVMNVLLNLIHFSSLDCSTTVHQIRKASLQQSLFCCTNHLFLGRLIFSSVRSLLFLFFRQNIFSLTGNWAQGSHWDGCLDLYDIQHLIKNCFAITIWLGCNLMYH